MDPIERSRQRAAELHNRICATGIATNDLLGIVRAAVAICSGDEVELQKVEAGSPVLQGCHAHFDGDLYALSYGDTGDVFIDAFHIAHELGHLEFGGRVHSAVVSEPDPYRSAEVASVGMERAVDYGRRQRREVQMDLFARELLFPRELARRMHVEDGRAASQISKALGVPYDVVAQQIMDAILLPVRPAFVAKSAPPKPLNGIQAAAAAHRRSPFLLDAGPGTGKTQTLVARLLSLRDEGADSERILVLTYSNKAAREMLERITSAWPDAAGKMWIGTFHSFGLDLIRRFYDRIGLPDNPGLMDQTEAIELLEKEFAHLDLTHFRELYDPTDKLRSILSAISRAKDEVVSADRYEELAQAMVQEADPDDEAQQTSALICSEIARVYKLYERLKGDRQKLDFGDLVARPVTFLESDDVSRGLVQSEYDHVLVDEYQDVNRASVRLLKTVAGDGNNLWVVGDAKQSIFRFRGASSFNLARFETSDFPGGQRMELTTNYRSGAEICRTFEAFAQRDMRNAGSGFRVDAARGELGVRPQFIRVINRDDELEVLAQSIEQQRQDGVAYCDQAVLCKGNARLAELAAGLEQKGVPVLFLGPLFDRDEIKEMMSLLSLAVDARPMGLIKAACMPVFAMELNDVEVIVQALKDAQVDQPKFWSTFEIDSALLSPKGRIGFGRLQEIFSSVPPEEDPWSLLTRILMDETRHLADLHAGTTASDRNAAIAIWQFMNFLKTFPKEGEGYPIRRLAQHVRRIALLADDRDLRELPDAAKEIDAVRLMTMHGAKGLEFPVVHLPGLTADSIPRGFGGLTKPLDPPDGMIEGVDGSGMEALKEGHAEEQECLFFVALSRAEDKMFLYAPTQQKAKGTRKPGTRNPSPFLNNLAGHLDTPPVSMVTADLSGRQSPTTVAFDRPLQLLPAVPDQYKSCPRKMFYTHVMKLGGRRRETPFMQMHNAVQHFVDAVKVINGETLVWEDVEPAFEAAWAVKGPNDVAYQDDYRRIALDLCRYYMSQHAGVDGVGTVVVRYAFEGCFVDLRADEVLTSGRQSQVQRRVRTGRSYSKLLENLEVSMFFLSSEQVSEGLETEVLFLTDQETVPVAMKTTMARNRATKLAEIADKIHRGHFETNPTDRCPNCANYFVCGTLPEGTVRKRNLN